MSDIDVATLESGGVLLRAEARSGDPVDIGGEQARRVAARLVELTAGFEASEEIGAEGHSGPHLLDATTFPSLYAFIDEGGTIGLKAVDTAGEPVELTPSQARHVARELVRLAEEYERWVP